MVRWPDGFQTTATTWAGLLARAAERDPGQEVVFPTERCTFSELENRAYRLAAQLVDAGVEPGDSVGILLPPHLDYLVSLFAVSLAGGVCVPISTRFKTSELAYAIPLADVRIMITSNAEGPWGDLISSLDAALPTTGRPSVLVLEDLTAAGATTRLDVVRRAVMVRVADPAFILFTSGTSANAKGCILTHESITRQAESIGDINLAMTSDDCLASPLPLFHIAGLAIYAASLHAGAKFCHSSYMEPADAAAQLRDEQVTVWYAAFDTIFAPILDRPDFDQTTMGQLRVMFCAGTFGLVKRVQARLPWTSVLSSYGSTEAGGTVMLPYPSDPPELRLESAGRVVPGVEIRLVDPDTGRVVGPDERGEVQLRGPQIFRGYYHDDEANALAFVDGGWFRTGDLATITARGQFRFDGRLKDMMKVGGENVAAVEVEAYLIGHPAIQVVSVVGAPDEKYTEVPAAFIEVVPGAELTAEDVIAFCTGRIASYKVPRHVRFVTEWPMSGTKIQKYVLRDRLAAELADSR